MPRQPALTEQTPASKSQSWWSSLFGSTKVTQDSTLAPEGIARKPITSLSPAQRDQLNDYYVRLRYNDKVMQIPGCKAPGKHLEGDTSFCTLDAFKSIVDKYTPKNWKAACVSRLEEPAFPEKVEPAGFE
jgi:acid phosphatase